MSLAPPESDAEIQGWYHRNNTSKPVRVRLAVEEGSVSLFTLSGRLVANWSLNHLETRDLATLGERWSIGDQRVPEAFLVLESDQNYLAIRRVATSLRPVRARLWRQLGLSAIKSGNLTGWPVLLLLVGASAVYWLWRTLPWQYCVATRHDTTLFLNGLIVDHFIPKSVV